LAEQGTITTVNGQLLKLRVDSLCVHGDNLTAVNAIGDIRRVIGKQ
jgi:UPF0271 protein